MKQIVPINIFVSVIGFVFFLVIGCTGGYQINTYCDSDSAATCDSEIAACDVIDKSVDKYANNSTMIGRIFLGMNRKEFAQAKSKFLMENPLLSDLRIASLQGYFYDNKLVRITIVSDPHFNRYGGLSESYRCTQWTDLYKQKHKIYNGSEIFAEVFGESVFSKGRCLIIVTDSEYIGDMPKTWDNDLFIGLEELDSNPLSLKRLKVLGEEAKALSHSTPGASYSQKRYSRIDIIDRALYLRILNERENNRAKSREDRKKQDFDLI